VSAVDAREQESIPNRSRRSDRQTMETLARSVAPEHLRADDEGRARLALEEAFEKS
jgi:hypothetical protein